MIYITAQLFVKEGKESIFHKYENTVLPILKKHKGVLIHRIRLSENNFICESQEKQPYEIHLISFPSDNDFRRYLKDSERISYNHLKDDAIESSYIYKGEKL